MPALHFARIFFIFYIFFGGGKGGGGGGGGGGGERGFRNKAHLRSQCPYLQSRAGPEDRDLQSFRHALSCRGAAPLPNLPYLDERLWYLHLSVSFRGCSLTKNDFKKKKICRRKNCSKEIFFTYHVKRGKAYMQGNPSRKPIIDSRADDQFISFFNTFLESGSRG